MTAAPDRIAAAIDVGSNSVHLLVASLKHGHPRAIRDESVLLGLGAVVDLEGRIPDADRTLAVEALAEYVRTAIADGAATVTLLATEPLRRASNRTRFCEEAQAVTGYPMHVLSHEEEAELTLLGVLGGEEPQESTLVLDIGGGSTELIVHRPGEDPVVGAIPVGSARLTASFVEDDPPTREEIAALRAEARRLLAGMPVGHPTRGIVVGGSGTNVLRLTAAGERREDGPAPNMIDRHRLEEALTLVSIYPAAEIVARFGLRERRALQLAAGAALIEATMSEYGLETMEVSDASLREGAVIAVARAGDSWRERLSELVATGL